MADFDNLKEIIRENISTNGRQLITGSALQAVLLAMVEVLGNIEFLTEAQYDALETKEADKIYYIYENQ